MAMKVNLKQWIVWLTIAFVVVFIYRDPSGPSGRHPFLSRLLPTPDEVLQSYLTHDEIFILVDEPATSAFLVDASNEILIIVVIALVTGFAVGQGGGTFAAILGLMVIG